MESILRILPISFEQGFAYSLVAIGIVISFRILSFPDLTVDGSFPLGAAVAARMIIAGYHPIVGVIVAVLAGFLAGYATGFLNIVPTTTLTNSASPPQ
jgi:putative ABC transport system permease protein